MCREASDFYSTNMSFYKRNYKSFDVIEIEWPKFKGVISRDLAIEFQLIGCCRQPGWMFPNQVARPAKWAYVPIAHDEGKRAKIHGFQTKASFQMSVD